MPLTRDAAAVWKSLNGIICVYKPADYTSHKVRKTIIGNICRDLNQLDCRPPTRHILIESSVNTEVVTAETKLSVRVLPSFADLVSVTGPHYIPKDVRCRWSYSLGNTTSGVLLLGINRGVFTAEQIMSEHPLRTLQLKCRLGRSTDTGWAHLGKATMKANYMHVPREALDRMLAAVQAAHQRQAFNFAGVAPESQQAYEMAKQGIVKPASTKGQLIYGARCISFEPPDFTVEIHCINDREEFLLNLIAEIGRRVRSAAACVSIRCIREGPFEVDHALAKTQWSLDHIVTNMRLCENILRQHKKTQELALEAS